SNRKIPYEAPNEASFTWIVAISVVVPVIVAILLFLPNKIEVGFSWVYLLPHLNAVINSCASLALIMGLWFIKRKKIAYHKMAMSTAMGLGFVFLVSYLIYHGTVESTSFGGEGMVKSVYY